MESERHLLFLFLFFFMFFTFLNFSPSYPRATRETLLQFSGKWGISLRHSLHRLRSKLPDLGEDSLTCMHAPTVSPGLLRRIHLALGSYNAVGELFLGIPYAKIRLT